MNKNKYMLFRYRNASGQFYLVTFHDIAKYQKLHEDDIKLIKEFDNFEEAAAFGAAMELL